VGVVRQVLDGPLWITGMTFGMDNPICGAALFEIILESLGIGEMAKMTVKLKAPVLECVQQPLEKQTAK